MRAVRQKENNNLERITTKPAGKPELEFIYYPYYFRLPPEYSNLQSAAISELSTNNLQIDVKEFRYKPKGEWPTVSDFTLNFTDIKAAEQYIDKGYFNIAFKVSSKIFDVCIKRFGLGRVNMNLGIHICFTTEIDSYPVQVTLAIAYKNLRVLGEFNHNFETIMRYLEELSLSVKCKKVILQMDDQSPFWKPVFIEEIKANSKLMKT